MKEDWVKNSDGHVSRPAWGVLWLSSASCLWPDELGGGEARDRDLAKAKSEGVLDLGPKE